MSVHAEILDALADCLESGDPLPEALAKVAQARGAAGVWARRVPHEATIAAALRAARALDPLELTILDACGEAAAPSALRAIAARRRRARARARALGWGLAGPLGFGALAVALDPLPNLVSGEPFAWPLARGLLELGVLALALLVGAPALLRRPGARSAILGASSVVPGLRWLAEIHAEEELCGALPPFVEGGAVKRAGLSGVATLLAWSPLGGALREAAAHPTSGVERLPLGGLEPLAAFLTPATGLVVVAGAASKHLGARLAARAEELGAIHTARLRLVVRVVAYTLVVLFSFGSLMGMVSRGLPGMPTLPGADVNEEQKQLEDLLKQLGQ